MPEHCDTRRDYAPGICVTGRPTPLPDASSLLPRTKASPKEVSRPGQSQLPVSCALIGLLDPRNYSGFSGFKVWFCHLLRGIQSGAEACSVRPTQHPIPIFSSLIWQV